MYYRKGLKVDKLHINNLPAMSHMEILSIYIKSEDVILSTIYRHPNSTMSQFLSSLEDIISQNSFQNTSKNKIFLGDFNINTLVQNKNSVEYLSLLNSFDYSFCINEPTRTTASSSSCIDHVFSNIDEHNYLEANVCDFQVSDHNSIVIQFQNTNIHTVKILSLIHI